jgi:hypothetical protein
MALSEWNKFVKKIYHENKSKPGYKFKDALTEASKRKGEMGSTSTVKSASTTQKRKRSRSSSTRGKRKSRSGSKKSRK